MTKRTLHFSFSNAVFFNAAMAALALPAFLLSRNVFAAGPLSGRPNALQCDSLVEPLGLDTMHPRLSWHLQDQRNGARQTAYQIGVFSRRPLGPTSKPDVWDSGRAASEISAGVSYAGQELRPEKRYFWRVTVWDREGKAYPASDVSWFKAGLLQQSNWHLEWIGYEPAELHSIRESGAAWITYLASTSAAALDTHYDFRYRFAVDKPIELAVLYTTGKDTAAAWVNGKQVLQAKPLPPWKGMPWGTYERVEVTPGLHQGQNLLAIGITRFKVPGAHEVPTQTAMSAVMYVAFTDGSTRLFTSSADGWKAQLDAPEAWWQPEHKDGNWKSAQRYEPPAANSFGDREEGLPWPTGPVASLRKTFSPQFTAIVSARLYATTLGAYKFHLNGSAVGYQILSPGWMDFREHVPYQVYDVTRQVHGRRNALSAYLAPDWYSTPLRWTRQGNNEVANGTH